VLQDGDTLGGIALAVYGDASLWYLIADANGLSGDADLQALAIGTSLTLPNTVSNIHNNADTFKPYDPHSVVGDTTPTIKPPPPPKHHSNIIASILVIVVTVVVTYFTFGATSELLGTEIAGLAASGAVAAAAGSVAGQLTGMALGAQDKFSFSAVGTAAIGGAIGGGLASLGGGALAQVGESIASDAATQGVNVALGQQDHFSWAEVAASAALAGLEYGAGKADPDLKLNQYGASTLEKQPLSLQGLVGGTIKNFAEGVIKQEIRSTFEQGGRLSLATIAADSFGNALGSSIVGAIESTPGEGQQQAEQDRLIAENSANTISEDEPITSGPQQVAARYDQLSQQSGGDAITLSTADYDPEAAGFASRVGVPATGTPGTGILSGSPGSAEGGTTFYYDSEGDVHFDAGLTIIGSGNENPALSDAQLEQMAADNGTGSSVGAAGGNGFLSSVENFFSGVGNFFSGSGQHVIGGLKADVDVPVAGTLSALTYLALANTPTDPLGNSLDPELDVQQLQLASRAAQSVRQATSIGASNPEQQRGYDASVTAQLITGAAIGGVQLLRSIPSLIGGAGLAPGVAAQSATFARATAEANSVESFNASQNATIQARQSAAQGTAAVINGETSATATGKAVHSRLATERRASGNFDLVNEPLTDDAGNPILVTRRVDLSTGEALPESGYQVARPDAVRFSNDVILDDKPLGRPISKDQQEIIRFINAYSESQGNLPRTIAIQRYNPVTGEPVVTELYDPSDFLP
jgi:hypothetical protein